MEGTERKASTHGSVKYLFHGTPPKTPLHLSVGVLVFAIDKIEIIQQHYTHGTERNTSWHGSMHEIERLKDNVKLKLDNFTLHYL